MLPALLVVLVELGLLAASSTQERARDDVVIRGGRVLEGTGNPFFHADVDAGELTGALAGEVLTPRSSGRPASH
jgi:hypothetical protein